MHYLGIILASIAGYFIGSISGSILIVNGRKGLDIRSTGSGNAGATNTVRLMGPGGGLLVAVLDGLKVVLTALIAVLFSLIPNSLFGETSYFIPCLFVLIGHCGPAYYKFKGGKAVSCFIGLLFISNIGYFLIFLIAGGITAAISRKVSLSSLVGAGIIALVIWLPGLNGLMTFAGKGNSGDAGTGVGVNPGLRFSGMNYLHGATMNISQHQFADGMLEIIIINFLSGGLLIYRHAANIKRLKNHEEPQTFPRLTKAERHELSRLRKQSELTHKERNNLYNLESKSREEKRFHKIKRHIAKQQVTKNSEKAEKIRTIQNEQKNKRED